MAFYVTFLNKEKAAEIKKGTVFRTTEKEKKVFFLPECYAHVHTHTPTQKPVYTQCPYGPTLNHTLDAVQTEET